MEIPLTLDELRAGLTPEKRQMLRIALAEGIRLTAPLVRNAALVALVECAPEPVCFEDTPTNEVVNYAVEAG